MTRDMSSMSTIVRAASPEVSIRPLPSSETTTCISTVCANPRETSGSPRSSTGAIAIPDFIEPMYYFGGQGAIVEEESRMAYPHISCNAVEYASALFRISAPPNGRAKRSEGAGRMGAWIP